MFGGLIKPAFVFHPHPPLNPLSSREGKQIIPSSLRGED
jgi:hypothetical protein